MVSPPVRVLHITQALAGGIASFFEEIARYQSSIFGKENVRFAVPEDSEKHLPSIDPSQLITCGSTARGPVALMKFALAANRIIRDYQPHIVHLHSSFAGALVRTNAAFRRSGAALVYCPHGWSFAMDTTPARKYVYAAIEKKLARLTDLIIVNSQSEYDYAMAFGLPPEKLNIVKNGITCTPAPKILPKSGPLRLIFVGRHDRQKGLDILFDAIENHNFPDIEFHIVGDSILGNRRDRSTPMPPNVIFHGWLARSQVIPLVERMDALVVPSRWEAFGLVAIEAMRAGVPVVASNRGALPEIVQDGTSGYIFDLGDKTALPALLRKLDRDKLKRLGANARIRFEREYNADRMNQSTVAAYERMLAAKGENLQATATLPLMHHASRIGG